MRQIQAYTFVTKKKTGQNILLAYPRIWTSFIMQLCILLHIYNLLWKYFCRLKTETFDSFNRNFYKSIVKRFDTNDNYIPTL